MVRNSRSHPAGVRGLEPLPSQRFLAPAPVAPRGGAWIGTHQSVNLLPPWACRTPRGCVDWNAASGFQHRAVLGRTPRGCVDWNQRRHINLFGYPGRTPRGCVDWNMPSVNGDRKYFCRTPRGCVDWNTVKRRHKNHPSLSHPAGVRGLELAR